jgi:hypothetical protein
MPHLRISASLDQLPLKAFAGVQLRGSREEAFGVGRCAQQIGGFFKRLKVFEGEQKKGGQF